LLHRYRPCSKPHSIAAAPAQRSIVFRQLFFVGLFLPVSLLQSFCFISFQFFVPLPELCFFNFVEDYCLYLPLFDTGRLNLVGHFYLCIDSHFWIKRMDLAHSVLLLMDCGGDGVPRLGSHWVTFRIVICPN
jgi:hypothetical protein